MKGKKILGGMLTLAVILTAFTLLILTFCGIDFALFALIGVVVHYLVSVVVHELGHIVVAKLRNCEVVEWSILGFSYSKLTKKFKFSPKDYAGNVAFVSKNPDKAEEDLLVVSRSGLLANLIYLIICLVLGLIIFDFYSFAILMFASFITLYMLVINFIPITDSNDGAVYMGLKRGRIEYRATENLARILSHLYNGVTPAGIPKALFLYKDGLNSEGVVYYQMLALMEQGDFVQAYEIADEYAEVYPEQFLAEKVYLAILLGNNKFVDENFDRAIDTLNPASATYFRIMARYRRYTGEREWAELCEKSVLKANEGQFFKGLATFEENLINQN